MADGGSRIWQYNRVFLMGGKSGQTRILAIGEVGDKMGGDRLREHCIYLLSCAFWVIVCNTLNTKEILKIYHSDLSWYVSDCTVQLPMQ